MVIPPQNDDSDSATEGRRSVSSAVTGGGSIGAGVGNRDGGGTLRMSLGIALAILIPVLACGGLLIGLVAANLWGPATATAAFLASVICIAGSILGLLAGSIFTGPQAVNGLLLGLFCRMSLALGAGMVAMIGGWNGSRFVECLLANYLYSLVIDTVLAVWMLRSTRALRGT